MNYSYSSRPTEHLAAILSQFVGQHSNTHAQSTNILAEDPVVVGYALIIHTAALTVFSLDDRKTKEELMLVSKIEREIQFSMKNESVSKDSIRLFQKDWKEDFQQTADWTVPGIRNESGDRRIFSS